ncbi:unnamed protein product [Ectocarpus fasciculatus]
MNDVQQHQQHQLPIGMGTKIQGVGVSLGPVAFYFRQRHGKLDWKKLARIDVDEVVREVDIAVLQDLLDEVAFCEVSVEDIPPTGVDDLSVKLIRLSQLTIEYLLHVQECQEGYIQGLVRQLETANNNNQRLKAYAELSAKDGRRMKRESAQHQHVLSTCQSVLRQYGIDPRAIWESLPAEVAGGRGCSGPGAQPKDPQHSLPATGTPSCGNHKPSAPPHPVEDSGVAQGGHGCGAGASGGGGTSASGTPVARVCGACGKAFSSEQFLRKHMDRRHPDLVRRDTAPPEEASDDSPASLPVEETRATEEQPSPPQQQDQQIEAEGGKGTGGEDKGGSENGIGSEVVEGARRLRELVREREHARFKLEVLALRREVEDLKRKGEATQYLPQPQPQPQPLPSPPPTPSPSPSMPLPPRGGDGDRRRRRVRGVISIRRILREQDRRRKQRAMDKWRASVATTTTTTPTAVAAPVPQPQPPTPKQPIRRWGLDELLLMAHRRADRAAQEAAAGKGAHVEGSQPSHGKGAHTLRLMSGVEIGAHFPVDQQQAEEAREEVVRELRERARSYSVDAERAGMSGEEYQAMLGQVLAKRQESVMESSSTAATGLDDAYALVAKELRLAGNARKNNANSNNANTGTPRGSVHRRPSMEGGLLSSFPRPDSSGGAATTAATATARGSRLDTPSKFEPGVRSVSQTIGGGGSGSGGDSTAPFLTSRWQPPRSGGGGPTGTHMTGTRTGLGDGNAVEGGGREGIGLGWGGGGGVDSKEMLAIAKRTAEINWEAVKRRRSVSEAAKAAAASASATAVAGSNVDRVCRQGETKITTAAAEDLSTPNAKAPVLTASGASLCTSPSLATETPVVAPQSPVAVSSWQRSTSAKTADTLGTERKTLRDESLVSRGVVASEARESTNVVIQVESRSANHRNDVLANSGGQDEEKEETKDCDGDVGTATMVHAPSISGVDAGVGAGAGAPHNRRAVTESTSDTKQAEGGWAFATSTVSGVDIDRGSGEPAAAVAAVGLFGKDKRPRLNNALSFSDDEQEGDGSGDSNDAKSHSRTGDAAMVNPAGGGATSRPDDSLASWIPAKTHIRPMPSFSSSDASVVEEQLLEDFGDEVRPRMSSARQLPDKSGYRPVGDRYHAAVKDATFADMEEDEDQEKVDAGATQTATSALAMSTPVVSPREELAERASMRSINTAAAGGLAAQASVVGGYSEWDDDDRNGRDSGTGEGIVSPSFEPRPTRASDFLDGSTRNNSGRGAEDALNIHGGVTSAMKERRTDLDGGVVESIGVRTAAEVATEDGVEGNLADDGQEPPAMLSVVEGPEVQAARASSDEGSGEKRHGDSSGGEGGGEGGGRGEDGVDALVRPTYGFLTLGSGLSQFPKRKQHKSMSATAGEAPTVEVEVGQAWQGVDRCRNIPTRAPKEEEVAAGAVGGGGVDDGVIMVEDF